MSADLTDATKELLFGVAKAYVHRWLAPEEASTMSEDFAAWELFEHLKVAYVLGRVDQDTAKLDEQRPEDPTNPVRGPYVVHQLRYGVSACGISTEHGVPGNWPPGHRWTIGWPDVNCNACLAYRARLGGL